MDEVLSMINNVAAKVQVPEEYVAEAGKPPSIDIITEILFIQVLFPSSKLIFQVFPHLFRYLD